VTIPHVWLLCEAHKAGTWSQVRSIADIIKELYPHSVIEEHALKAPMLYAKLPHFLQKNSLSIHGLFPPYPDMVIASGRGAIAPALALKKKGVRVIFVLNPYVCPSRFDGVIAPMHDAMKGPNVIHYHGALHTLCRESLKKEGEEKASLFKAMPAPFTTLCIGGNARHYTFGHEGVEKTIASLNAILNRDNFKGSLLLTASRRTPMILWKALNDCIKSFPHIAYHPSLHTHQSNPYKAFLEISDRLILTPDSISMMSEAFFLGKPVFHTPLLFKNKRLNDFIEKSYDMNLLHPLNNWQKPIKQDPYDERAFIKSALIKHLQ
jgi:hypothetical protein